MSNETLSAPIDEWANAEQWMLVTLDRITVSDPPRITFTSRLTLRNGSVKPCTSVAQVTDAHLMQRLYTEVRPGDKIRICIKTDWNAEDIPTTLQDFCRV